MLLSDWITVGGMSLRPDQPLNRLSSGSRPPWATSPDRKLDVGLATSGTAPEMTAACSFWSCSAIGRPTYWTVIVGLAASNRRMSSCQTGVRSGPAFVSQKVMVTGALDAAEPPPPLLLVPPQAAARSAASPSASALDTRVRFVMSASLPPLLAPCTCSCARRGAY